MARLMGAMKQYYVVQGDIKKYVRGACNFFDTGPISNLKKDLESAFNFTSICAFGYFFAFIGNN